MSTPGPPAAVEPSELRVGWIMPPFVHELPLDAVSDDEAGQELYELSQDLLPGSSQDDQLALAQLLGAQLIELKSADGIYAGMCFLEVEGIDTLSTVLVTQFAHDLDEEDGAEQLLRTVETAYPHDEVFPVKLPCGPAVTRVAQVPVSVRDADDGGTADLPRGLLQTYVPLPGTTELLLFELSVFTPQGWETHSELFAEILRTIDWATDMEVAQYTSAHQPAVGVVPQQRVETGPATTPFG